MKILHILPFNKPGGLSLRTYRVSKYLNKNTELENIILVPETNGDFYDRVKQNNIVDIYSMNYYSPKYFTSLKNIKKNGIWFIDFPIAAIRFKQFINRHEIDVVHVNEIFLLQAGVGASLSDAAVAWHLISDQFPRWFVRSLMPLIDSIADIKMIVTEANKEYYFGKNVDIGCRDDLRIVPGVADTNNFNPSAVDAKRQREIQHRFNIDDQLVLTTVANLNPTKGIEYVINAIKDIDINIKYLIVGKEDNEKYSKSLKELVKQEDLEDDVVFTGYIEGIAEVLSITDIFVLPSLGEGTPLSLIEAMSMEIPIIATDVGGVEDMLEGGKGGQVIPRKSERAIREALKKYIDDDRLREKHRKNARCIVEARFSIEQLTQLYHDTYQAAIQMIKTK